MHNERVAVYSKLVLAIVGSFLVGCLGGPSELVGSGNAPAPQDAPAVPVLDAADAVLLAKLELSPTHRIEFRAFPKEGLLNVREWLHADADGMNKTYRARVAIDASMTEVYVAMAGEKVDWRVADLLGRAEQGLELNVTSETAGRSEAAVAPPVAAESAPSPSPATAGGENLETTLQANCQEPTDFNWFADAQWFNANFWVPGTQFFKQAQAPLKDARGGHPQSDSSHFNESFCNNLASFHVKQEWACISGWPFESVRCSKFLAQGFIPARTVQSESWRKKNTDVDDNWPTFTVDINSATNFQALGHFVH